MNLEGLDEESSNVILEFYGDSRDLAKQVEKELRPLLDKHAHRTDDDAVKVAFNLVLEQAKKRPGVPLDEQIKDSLKLLILVTIHSRGLIANMLKTHLKDKLPPGTLNRLIREALNEDPRIGGMPEHDHNCDKCDITGSCPIEAKMRRKNDSKP